jgi:hypothetical protein
MELSKRRDGISIALSLREHSTLRIVLFSSAFDLTTMCYDMGVPQEECRNMQG